jgi:hypothetical protein
MVVALMRTNLTQEVAGGIFGCSQATVPRRWDLLRPAIGQVLASCVPDPRQIPGGGTAPVDGTIAPPGTGPRSRTCSPARPATPA